MSLDDMIAKSSKRSDSTRSRSGRGGRGGSRNSGRRGREGKSGDVKVIVTQRPTGRIQKSVGERRPLARVRHMSGFKQSLKLILKATTVHAQSLEQMCEQPLVYRDAQASLSKTSPVISRARSSMGTCPGATTRHPEMLLLQGDPSHSPANLPLQQLPVLLGAVNCEQTSMITS